MGAAIESLGLRERKKIRTKETIQREAYRLFDENGYANTTVEQIAEAAEVSPSTFFRYFPSKELVLMADDLDRVTVEALAGQPADLTPLQAFRRAFDITMVTVSEREWELERTRQRLLDTRTQGRPVRRVRPDHQAACRSRVPTDRARRRRLRGARFFRCACRSVDGRDRPLAG